MESEIRTNEILYALKTNLDTVAVGETAKLVLHNDDMNTDRVIPLAFKEVIALRNLIRALLFIRED